MSGSYERRHSEQSGWNSAMHASLVLTFILGAAVIVWEAGGHKAYDRIHNGVDNTLNHRLTTEEQREAERLFYNVDDSQLVKNITVREEVRMRDRPGVPGDNGEHKEGAKKGQLEPGTVIDRAIVVLGNDPHISFDKDEEDLWYAFPDPSDPDRIVFSNAAYFNPILAAYEVEAFNLD